MIRMMLKMTPQTHATEKSVSRLAGGINAAMNKSVLQEGHELVRFIKDGLRYQTPGGDTIKPISSITRAIRKAMGKPSSKALIVDGDMWRSVKLDEVKPGELLFVGVSRRERSRDGKYLANIAEVHEFGTKNFTIRVTPKLRRWWMAMWAAGVFSAPLKASTKYINHPGVPARPWLRPGYELWSRKASDRFVDRLSKNLPDLAAFGVR